MEPAAGGCTGAGNVAAVLGNLGLHQYNVQQNHHLKQYAANMLLISARPLLYAKCTVKSMIKTGFSQLFYTINIKNKSRTRNLWKLQRLTEISQEKDKKRKKSGKNEQNNKNTGQEFVPVR